MLEMKFKKGCIMGGGIPSHNTEIFEKKMISQVYLCAIDVFTFIERVELFQNGGEYLEKKEK